MTCRAVHLDVLFPGAEVGGDLFIELPRDDVLHDFTLARGEGGEPGGQAPRFRYCPPPGSAVSRAARTAWTSAAASRAWSRNPSRRP